MLDYNILNSSIEQRDRDLIRQLNEYKEIIDNNLLVFNLDSGGNIVDISLEFCQCLGYEKSDIIGSKIEELLLLNNERKTNIWIDKDNSNVEMNFKCNDGTILYTIAKVKPLFCIDNECLGQIVICKDISCEVKAQEDSIIDDTTKLFNDKYFNMIFDKEMNRTRRDENIFVLILFEVDYFDRYIETYGKIKSQEMLIRISDIISKELKRASDTAFRIKNSEFAVILNLEKSRDIESIVERIRESIEKAEIKNENSSVCSVITVSMGVKCIDFKYDYETTRKDIYREAYEALTRAKENGMNKFIFATS